MPAYDAQLRETPTGHAACRGTSRFHLPSGPVARLVGVLLLCSCASPALATDLPWLPPRGSATLAVELTEASAENFHGGKEATELTFGAIDQEIRSARLTLAIGRNWAIDGTIGDVLAQASDPLGSLNGANDSGLGLIWRPVNEQVNPAAPSIAFRVGWIGAGDYPADRVHAHGPAGNGTAVSLAIGKVFREALSFSATLGGRMYAEPVPAVVTMGVSAALLSQPATLSRILGGMEGGMIFRATYRREFPTGDIDIVDPYQPMLDDAGFPEVARGFSRGALGVAIAAGPMELAAEAFRYLAGRNVPQYQGVTVRVTLKADLLTLLGLL